ncbi:MAG: hypothetical protein JSW40_04035 [Candidatus Omnitrophota bacterium]|nr:MAG: hypothetical protein JSW40_04035 [Candidatus Omnitrophota bacterium]
MLKTIKLYQGKVVLQFDDETHRFFHEDGTPIKNSVSGITGVVDKSGPLMAWAVNMMGEYLIENWSLKKVKTETAKIQLIFDAKKNYRWAKKEAMDIGTAIHEWIEQYIKGKKPALPEEERTRNGVLAFMGWVKEHKVKFLESEKIVYSRRYDYPGILDAIADIEKKRYVIDFKSSRGIYNEMRYQLAAYQLAYEEEMGKCIDGRIIVKLGKEDGDFEAREIDGYQQDKRAFLAALTIKQRENELK